MADVVIIGGGMAGVSAGAFLCESGAEVHLVEAEATLAHHSTGRSAAQYLENYGSPQVRRITSASRRWFVEASDAAAAAGDGPLWSPLAMMAVGGDDRLDELRAEVAAARELAPTTAYLDRAEAMARCPVLRPDMVSGALYETDAMDMDVAAIHQTFVRTMRSHGATITTAAPVTDLEQVAGRWRVTAGEHRLESPVVINAAGAWGDVVAGMAQVPPIGLRPLRRTVAIVRLPDDVDASGWPMVALNGHGPSMEGYMKAEPGGLLVSPADEIPSEPCDARPEEIDVARGLDAVQRWTTLAASSVSATWAGLRTFSPDGGLVAGFDPEATGFCWLVGQGGYGIQTAPGMGMAVAALAAGHDLPADLTAVGLSSEDLGVERLRA